MKFEVLGVFLFFHLVPGDHTVKSLAETPSEWKVLPPQERNFIVWGEKWVCKPDCHLFT